MRKGDRVVVKATGEAGVIVENEVVFGKPSDLWSERHFTVALDADEQGVAPLSIAEHGVVLESVS